MSMYGGTMIPPHPQMAEAPGGPVYNGLHTSDPAWNPILKVVPNSAESSDPQQVIAISLPLFLYIESKTVCNKIPSPLTLSLNPCCFRYGLALGPHMWEMCI